MHEQLTENDTYETVNLISAVQYAQSLEKLQACLTRHIEVTREAWQLDQHFRVSERAISELERQGYDIERSQSNLQPRTKDPPRIHQNLRAREYGEAIC